MFVGLSFIFLVFYDILAKSRSFVIVFAFVFLEQLFYRMSRNLFSHLIRFKLNIFGNIPTQVNSKGHFVPSLGTKFGHL